MRTPAGVPSMLNLGKIDLRSHYATHRWRQPYHWYECGSGPPLVLLHGYMAHAMAWRRVLSEFSGFRIIVPDLPGHGWDRTFEDPELEPTVAGLTLWLDTFLSGLDEPAHIVAHSMGALAATRVRQPMASLTLVAPGLRIPAPRWTSKVVAAIPTGLGRLSGTRAALKFYEPVQWKGVPMNDAERHAYLRPLRDPRRIEFMLKLGADLLTEPDRLRRLTPPDCPTLVVWGEHDHLLPLKDALETRRHLGGCALAIIPSAGHAIMEDQPAAFSDVLGEFIRDLVNPSA